MFGLRLFCRRPFLFNTYKCSYLNAIKCIKVLKKISLFILISIAELLIYFYSGTQTDEHQFKWQLASRYSARLSFLILFSVQIFIALRGYRSALQKSDSLKLLIFAFGFNHIIHLVFLMYNMYLMNWPFSIARHAAAGLVYILLPFILILLSMQKELVKKEIWLLGSFLFYASIVFNIAYVGRVTGEALRENNPSIILGLFILSVCGTIALLFGFFKDRKAVA